MMTDREYLQLLEELILTSRDIGRNSRAPFLAAVGRICEAAGVSCLTLMVEETGEGAGMPVREQLYPADRDVEAGGGEERKQSFHFEDVEITVRVVWPAARGGDMPDPGRIDAALHMIATHAHRLYLYRNRNALEHFDPQTGVYNQQYAMGFLEDLVERGRAEGYMGCSFNVRGMSVINNRFGTDNGTQIMRRFVQGLQGRISPDGIVARVASDRFIAFFRGEQSEDVIQYLSGHEMGEDEIVNTPLVVSAWAGYDHIRSGEVPLELIDRLNDALHTAKYNSNSTWLFYNERIRREVGDHKHIESLFPSALRDGEFLVYYQPKVDLNDYSLIGAEALCRWVHDGSMIFPDRFISVLESSGDICTLDFYMLDRVCRDIRAWMDAGLLPVRVSVNLSRCHMGNPALASTLLEIIDRHGVPHEAIEIELTETVSDMSLEEQQQLVTELKEQGVCCSVDDFGVGYSSMSALQETPWGLIKIDRSFMPTGEAGDGDDKKTTMLKTLIGLTHTLGIRCLAEGVETVNQAVLLKTCGCTLAQGYYFDRPMPESEFIKKLIRN